MACQGVRGGVHQSGAVLPVSMVLLIVMTLLVLSSSQATGLQERRAVNQRDSGLVRHAAEASLRAAEGFLDQALPAGESAQRPLRASPLSHSLIEPQFRPRPLRGKAVDPPA